jgi:hypothetical protein
MVTFAGLGRLTGHMSSSGGGFDPPEDAHRSPFYFPMHVQHASSFELFCNRLTWSLQKNYFPFHIYVHRHTMPFLVSTLPSRSFLILFLLVHMNLNISNMQVYVLLLPHKCMIIHLRKLQSPFTVEYYKEEVVKAKVQIHGHMIPMFCPLQDAVLVGVIYDN